MPCQDYFWPSAAAVRSAQLSPKALGGDRLWLRRATLTWAPGAGGSSPPLWRGRECLCSLGRESWGGELAPSGDPGPRLSGPHHARPGAGPGSAVPAARGCCGPTRVSLERCRRAFPYAPGPGLARSGGKLCCPKGPGLPRVAAALRHCRSLFGSWLNVD